MGRGFAFAMLIGACIALPAMAGTARVSVRDQDGHPVADAVVELVAPAGVALPASRLPDEARIDQRDKTFFPLVSLIRKGGHIVFLNNDTTMHQVYSFSDIKPFQFEIDQGQRSQPVTFERAGVAAIGCNIHDQMITYVYVAESPFAAITGKSGDVSFADVPDGTYRVRVWHPRLPPGTSVPPRTVVVGDNPAAASVALSLLAPPNGSRMHMGAY